MNHKQNEFTERERAECERIQRNRESIYAEINDMLHKYRLDDAGTAKNIYKDGNYIGKLFLDFIDREVSLKISNKSDINEIKFILEKNRYIVKIDEYPYITLF